jgi:hypothetical protein
MPEISIPIETKTPNIEEQWKTDPGKHDNILNRRFKVIKVKESTVPVDALHN